MSRPENAHPPRWSRWLAPSHRGEEPLVGSADQDREPASRSGTGMLPGDFAGRCPRPSPGTAQSSPGRRLTTQVQPVWATLPASAPAVLQSPPRALLQAAPRMEARPSGHEDDASPTFESCAKIYIAAQEPAWKSNKHGKQWLSTLKTCAFPVIGKLHPSAVIIRRSRTRGSVPSWSISDSAKASQRERSSGGF